MLLLSYYYGKLLTRRQSKDLTHCLRWYGLKSRLDTDPVVQHLVWSWLERVMGRKPADGGFCVSLINQTRTTMRQPYAAAVAVFIFAIFLVRPPYGHC